MAQGPQLTDDARTRLIRVVADYGDVEIMDFYGSPEKLYQALVRDAKAQTPPYLSRDPETLYEIAVRNRWQSVRGILV